MDGFHQPRAIRHRQGRSSADGYYEDAYDVDAIRNVLLDPLGEGGNRRYRKAVIDLSSDTRLVGEPLVARGDAVPIVDGSFLQKPTLQDAWDLVIYLRAGFDAAEDRGARRDAGSLGGLDQAEPRVARGPDNMFVR